MDKGSRVLLQHSKLLDEDQLGKVPLHVQPFQGRFTELRHAGGQKRHVLPLPGALFQKGQRPRFGGDLGEIGLPAQLGPFVHNGLGAHVQVVVVDGELGGQREDRVPHRLAVFPGGGQPPTGQKGVVNYLPYPVGVH